MPRVLDLKFRPPESAFHGEHALPATFCETYETLNLNGHNGVCVCVELLNRSKTSTVASFSAF